MQTYTTHILALIAPTFDGIYGSANRPAGFYYVDEDLTGFSPCVGQDGNRAPYDTNSYFYCGADRAIYTGQDMLWHFYADLGDAAPAVGYAHEWAHHIQNIMGVPAANTVQESVQLENQADCIAGAWLYDVDTKGYVEYPDDLGDISVLLQEIASSESDINRGHGTLEERTDSLEYGYSYGLQGCNQYFPSTPIYTGPTG